MKIFGNDETLDGDDMNYLSARAVNVYASEAARSQGIPSPFAGQEAWVTGVGLTVYNGSAWARYVPIPAGGTSGQVLKKISDADYDFGWAT